VLLAAEILVVVGLAQPPTLARLLARSPAGGFGTVLLAVAQARIAAEQFLATQASTSSGFNHGITGLQVHSGTTSCPTTRSAGAAPVYALIPIAVFISIDAGTASSSAFQRTLKKRSR
jgi:hypothetical protein